ncbi:MAG: metal-dependent hydrolase [Bacteroidia bacterium]|nr:metal-dependent hydrolase [Bacteroidia bacterium]
MDTFTQITLGAAVGQAVGHRDIGNKAILWGAFGGLLPDLDMLFLPLLDPVTQLSWHRGISHGILLILLLTPLLGWVMHKVHGGLVSMGKGALLVFLALSTHVLLDCFTVYGTGVFEPFSDVRLAWNNLFIIDPLYTLPLLIGVIASMFPGEVRAKLFRNAAGIIISSGYIIVTLALKFGTMPAFTRSLEEQNINYTRITTAPTALNCLLWRAVAEDAGGYWIGYYSVFDGDGAVKFWRVPRNEQLLAGLENERAVKKLKWFSDGWYSVSRDERGLRFHDLRFGEFDAAKPENSFGLGNPVNLHYVFTFRLPEAPPGSPDRYTVRQEEFVMPDVGRTMDLLWTRLKGIRPSTSRSSNGSPHSFNE